MVERSSARETTAIAPSQGAEKAFLKRSDGGKGHEAALRGKELAQDEKHWATVRPQVIRPVPLGTPRSSSLCP